MWGASDHLNKIDFLYNLWYQTKYFLADAVSAVYMCKESLSRVKAECWQQLHMQSKLQSGKKPAMLEATSP